MVRINDGARERRGLPRMSALLLAGLLGLVFAPNASEAKVERINDARIRKALTRTYEHRLPKAEDKISISVDGGVVLLRGTVYTLHASDRATALAKTLRGVRAVVNKLKVSPGARSDARIQGEISGALWQLPAIDRRDLKLSVDGGIVTLSGKVNSYQEQIEARKLAARTLGVTRVVDRTKLKQSPEREDGDLLADIEARLKADARLGASRVKVRVNDGQVTLLGKVSTVAQRERAIYDAWVRGVRSVDAEELRVYPARTAVQTRLPVVVDEDAERALELALRYDPRVPEDALSVKVERNRATLSGVVPSLVAHDAALEDARNTVGVTSVRDLLRVRWAKAPADNAIEARIKRRLKRAESLRGQKIHVSVHSGLVYLAGAVTTRLQRAQAEAVAQRTAGVDGVVSTLHSKTIRVEIGDLALRRAVADFIRWNPLVERRRIVIGADGGVVALSGKVASLAARDAAERSARVAGASKVNNWIVVDPSLDRAASDR